MRDDTIAAIATALSDSGIGIIRISGEKAIVVGDRIFRSPNGKKTLERAASHTIHYGYIVDTDNGQEDKQESVQNSQQDNWRNHIIDEVIVSVMRSPKSFTAEDTVEINCHGGVLLLRKILGIVCRNGARLAEPGEFTKRAFLNGRIDLSKAEAVIDVIHSKNEYALKSSMDQLNGKLSEKVRELRGKILYEIAFIESALDDPEHVSLEGYPEILSEKLSDIQDEINKLIATAGNGRLIKEGVSTVILGKPNVGKSSLLNLMVGEERAIVTEIAGTTRDALQETINFHGITLNMIDTAGIRETEDAVEKIGVERAKRYAENADLILYMIDSSAEPDEDDREILSLVKDKKIIILLNKTDLVQKNTVDIVKKDIAEKIWNLVKEIHGEENRDLESVMKNIFLIHTSTKDQTGMDQLEQTIKNLFFSGKIRTNDEIVIMKLRHKEALENAADSLFLVQKSIEDKMPEDFYSIDLMSAYASLGLIIGEEVEDDLIEEIFSEFCMGK